MANKENDPNIDDFKLPTEAKAIKRYENFPRAHFLAQKSDEEMKKVVCGYVPPNIAKNMSWHNKTL